MTGCLVRGVDFRNGAIHLRSRVTTAIERPRTEAPIRSGNRCSRALHRARDITAGRACGGLPNVSRG